MLKLREKCGKLIKKLINKIEIKSKTKINRIIV